MKGAEVLADLVIYLARSVRKEIEELSHEELTWQPDAEGNNIAITVWHFSRWLDLLTVHTFENRPLEEQQWYTRGWAKKTGYDPRGIGYQGFGVLTGYTQEEVAAVPVLDANDLLIYLDQACEALRHYLLLMPEATLNEPTPGMGGKRTQYHWIRSIVMGSFGHVGEIEALKAMQRRAKQ
jgi:hypothetical protein